MAEIDQLADQLLPPVAGARPVSAPPGADINAMADDLLPPVNRAESNLKPPPADKSVGWGPALSFINGLLLGGGKAVMAAGGGAEAPTPGTFPTTPEEYQNRKADLDVAQAAYAREHPTANMLAEMGGSTVATLPAMALGQEYAAAPLAARLGLSRLPGFLARTGERLLGGATQGAIAGGMTSGMNDESTGGNVLTGAGVGAAANTILGPLAGKFVSTISPEVADMAQRAVAQGIPLKTGQVPGAPAVTQALSKSATPEQIDALTAGVVKAAGGKGDVLNQSVVDDIKDSLGKRFDFIARGTSLKDPNGTLDAALAAVKDKIEGPYGAGTDQPATKSVAKLVDNLRGELLTGRISGDTYQQLTQKGSALQMALQRTSPARPYAIDIKNALDDSLAQNQPKLADALALTRHQWNNAILAEDVANETTGKVDPKALQSQVEKRFGTTGRASQKAAAVGAPADIGALAEAGTNFLSAPPKTSGALASLAHNIGPVGGIAGGIMAEHFLTPYMEQIAAAHPNALLAAGALGAGAAGRGVAGTVMNQPWYRNMLLRGGRLPNVNPLITPATQVYTGGPSQ